jgi:hypothetical protein
VLALAQNQKFNLKKLGALETTNAIFVVISKTQHKDLLSHMQSIISNQYLAIPEQGNEKLLTALRTAWAKELSLDKNVSVYNDALDALRLALRV